MLQLQMHQMYQNQTKILFDSRQDRETSNAGCNISKNQKETHNTEKIERILEDKYLVKKGNMKINH